MARPTHTRWSPVLIALAIFASGLVAAPVHVVLRRNNGARLSAVGRRIRETLAISRPGDPHCTDQAEFTRLLHWTKTNRWLVIDRFRACARGRVPAKIRMVTCESN